MKNLLKSALAAAAFAAASPVLAQQIIVVSHGQANDPFWSVVKNGVDTAAKEMGAIVS
jgi:simple sugar transport system substrate-binding protein